MKNNLGLYIHIPFCNKKCNYCDFYTVKKSDTMVDKFVDRLVFNIKYWSTASNGKVIDTIYFGGGTPTVLSEHHFYNLLNEIYKNFNVKKGLEITVESNVENLTYDYIKTLSKLGVNRVSVGAQSLNNDTLKYLGRTHRKIDIITAVNNLNKAFIYNISLDFIIGTKFDDLNTIKDNISFIDSNNIKHTSFYFLKIENGTQFYKDSEYNLLLDDDTLEKFYNDTVDGLKNIDIQQYEIANFSKKGFCSEHNLKYWKCDDYLGIGPSAHSLFNNERFFYKNGISSFLNEDVNNLLVYSEKFCNEDYVIMGLRLKKGVNINFINDVVKNKVSLMKRINKLVNNGLANFDNNTLNLTTRGFMVSNSVINYILN